MKVGEVLHIVGEGGLTLCCRAMTTIDESGVEYCKGCYEAVHNPGIHVRVALGGSPMKDEAIVKTIIGLLSKIETAEEMRQIKAASSDALQVLSRRMIRQMGPGQIVEFVARGELTVGKIVKVNRTRVAVIDTASRRWSVPPTMLTAATEEAWNKATRPAGGA